MLAVVREAGPVGVSAGSGNAEGAATGARLRNASSVSVVTGTSSIVIVRVVWLASSVGEACAASSSTTAPGAPVAKVSVSSAACDVNVRGSTINAVCAMSGRGPSGIARRGAIRSA